MNRDIWLAYFETHFIPAVDTYKHFITQQYRIAGLTVRIHYSQADLKSSLSPAISHREVPQLNIPSLDIFVWRRGEIVPTADVKGTCTGSSPKIKWNFHGDPAILSVYSAEMNKGYCLIDSHTEPMYWTVSCPFRRILDWHFAQKNIHIVHGAVVGDSKSAVLITGPSGAGKSTIAMQCAAQGMCYLSDDFVAVSTDLSAFNLYSSLKLLHDNPFILNSFTTELKTVGEKRVFLLNDSKSYQIPESIPLKAVIIPRKGNEKKPVLTKIESARTTEWLTPFALKQSAWVEKQVASDLSSITTQLPQLILHSGASLSDIPDLISNYCDS